MLESSLSSYISGLMHIASSISTNIGPSFIDATCFKEKNFENNFAKYYKIKQKDIELIETNIDLKQALTNWLGKEKQLIDSLVYWVELDIGKPKKVSTLKNSLLDLLSWSEGGQSPFYTVEDIYIIEFDKYIVCLILGNNE